MKNTLLIFIVLFAVAVALRSLYGVMTSGAASTGPTRRLPPRDPVHPFADAPAEGVVRIVEPHDQAQVLTRLFKARGTLYGAKWCGYTVKQLRELGFRYSEDGTRVERIRSDAKTAPLRYVACDTDPDACERAGVKAFPTWKIRKTLHPGFRTLEDLNKLSMPDQ